MAAAVAARRNFRESNTEVKVFEEGSVQVYLHGNCIYRAQKEGGVREFSLAGWNTPTTRERLTGCGVNVCQRNFVPYYKGEPISSTHWYEVQD